MIRGSCSSLGERVAAIESARVASPDRAHPVPGRRTHPLSTFHALLLLIAASCSPEPPPTDSPSRLPEPTGRLIASIGALEAGGAELFGRIVDVEVDVDGNVFVLDRQAAEVRWFGPDGEHRGTGGGAGGGPGELRRPRDAALSGDGRVHVLAGGKIATLRYGRNGLAHVRDVRTGVGANEMCALGDRLYLLTGGEDAVIHELNAEGGVKRSFAEPILGDEVALLDPRLRGYARSTHNLGKLYCGAPGVIVLLHRNMPLVRAFTPGGVALWTSRLADFDRTRLINAPTGGVTFAPTNPERHHIGHSVTALNDEVLAITIAEHAGFGGPRY